MPAAIAQHAEAMIGLWDEAGLQPPPSARGEGFDLDDAYAIAGEVLRRREQSGWRRVGRKIGFTNGEVMRAYGMAMPIFGYVYDRTLSQAGGREATIALEGIVQGKVEPEIVFKLRRRPPATRDPVALLESVEWLAQGFELVQCHFPDWKFAAPDAIADAGLHARYAAGPPTIVAPGAAAELARQLAGFRIELLLDGAVAAVGGGEQVLGSPVNALAHLIDVLAGRPGHPPLEAGELVTSGTLTAALPVAPGQLWTTRIAGLPVEPLALHLQ
jgi:2-oxo-3-hexenedioate decarboxylase